MLYEYAIGNTDVSIYALHNVKFVQKPGNAPALLVPYDFDLSGLVHAPYAIPDRRLGLRSVIDRMYRGRVGRRRIRGGCRRFPRETEAMLALLDSIDGLDRAVRTEMKDYLESFFRAIEKPESIKKNLVNSCKPQTTM